MKEIWKDVVGYEGLYQVSNLGRIKSLSKNNRKEIILCNRLNKKNVKKHYYHVGLTKNGIRKNLMIHRLVALSFLQNNLNYKTVNHKDGNKLNNNVNNLEWMSLSNNHKHAFLYKLRDNSGENHPLHKLTVEDVKFIKKSLLNNNSLGKMFNVTRQCISRIKSNINWKNI